MSGKAVPDFNPDPFSDMMSENRYLANKVHPSFFNFRGGRIPIIFALSTETYMYKDNQFSDTLFPDCEADPALIFWVSEK